MTGSAPLPGTARTRPDPRPSTGPVFDAYDFVTQEDPYPTYTRLRDPVSRGFTPRRVAGPADRIREIALRHLEPALERDSVNVRGFAHLPVSVVRS